MKYFFTSDLHLGHGNIITYCNRPFKSAFEMNEKLIANWNMRVKPEDIVFILGDFCFRTDKLTQEQLGGTGKEKASYWLNRLNGQKILVKGNHDRNNSAKTIIESIRISYANKNIHMCHKPEHANPNVDINLVGHVHNNWHIRTFQQHYLNLAHSNIAVKSDRNDWKEFLERNTANSISQSVLFNVGVDVNKYMPITIDEILGKIQKWKNQQVQNYQ